MWPVTVVWRASRSDCPALEARTVVWPATVVWRASRSDCPALSANNPTIVSLKLALSFKESDISPSVLRRAGAVPTKSATALST